MTSNNYHRAWPTILLAIGIGSAHLLGCAAAPRDGAAQTSTETAGSEKQADGAESSDPTVAIRAIEARGYDCRLISVAEHPFNPDSVQEIELTTSAFVPDARRTNLLVRWFGPRFTTLESGAVTGFYEQGLHLVGVPSTDAECDSGARCPVSYWWDQRAGTVRCSNPRDVGTGWIPGRASGATPIRLYWRFENIAVRRGPSCDQGDGHVAMRLTSSTLAICASPD